MHYFNSTNRYTLQVIASPTTLSTLKAAINAGADCSSYIGYQVNSSGAIGTTVSGTHIGYVACVFSDYLYVDYDFQDSRILVIAKSDAGTGLKWGSSGTNRNVSATRRKCYGYDNTNSLQALGQSAHPAAYAAWNYSATVLSGGSHWFQPTKWQMEIILDGFDSNSYTTLFNMSGVYSLSNETDGIYCSTLNTGMSLKAGLQDWTYNKESNLNVRSCFVY